MKKGFANPAADFIPKPKQEIQKPSIDKVIKVEEPVKEEVKPMKIAEELSKGKITKITIELDYEDSLKINRIVDAHKLMDPDSKYSKKWFLTKSVKEAIDKTMEDLNITL